MGSIAVKIKNFEAYKGRKDIKQNSWFRCSNRLLEDPDFFSFSAEEILVWIYILSLSSQKNSDTVHINFEHAERVARLKKKVVDSALNKLLGNQLLPVDVTPTLRGRNVDVTPTLRGRNADVTDACATLHYTTEQNTTEQNTVCTVSKLEPAPTEVLSSEDLIKLIPEEVRGLYPDTEFLPREAVKAWAWCQMNAAKQPKSVKGYKRFFLGWLERGWDRHRKTIQGSSLKVAPGPGGQGYV